MRPVVQPTVQAGSLLDDPGHCYRGPPISAKTFEGSFSAVWVATIATKYSFCSVFRDLQDLHSFAPLQFQRFRKSLSNFLQSFLAIFKMLEFRIKFVVFSTDFDDFKLFSEIIREFFGVN